MVSNIQEGTFKRFTADFIAAFIAEFTADQSVHFEPPESTNKPKIF